MTTNDGKWLAHTFEGTSILPESNLLEVLTKQCVEDSQRWFPDVSSKPDDTPAQTLEHLIHHTLAMFGEVGEFANIIKKIDRGSLDFGDPYVREHLAGELADVFIYLLNIAGILQLDLLKDYNWKRQFNEERFGRVDT